MQILDEIIEETKQNQKNIDIDRDPQSLHPVEHSISSNIYGVFGSSLFLR